MRSRSSSRTWTPRYRTLPSRDHRGLDGKSSGGYASLVLAMRNPQLFGAVASHSGDMYFEACYKVDFWRAADAIRKHGGLDGYLRAWREAPKKTDELVRPMVTVVCMAMAYSPNPQRPHGFDLPFDPETGEIDEAVWARWLDVGPGPDGGALRGEPPHLRLIYVECGQPGPVQPVPRRAHPSGPARAPGRSATSTRSSTTTTRR